MVAFISSESSTGDIVLSPDASEAHIIALCAALLDGGTLTLPDRKEGEILILCKKQHPFRNNLD